MNVQIVSGDLLDQDVEVIVNAWNRNVIPWWLLLPQGVSGAIKRRAGYAPFRELARQGAMPLEHAVVTSAGKLSFKAIIHVAGINLLWTATEKSIRLSVRNAMRLADERGFSSIAFPVIGAGSGRFQRDHSLEIMRDEFLQLNYTMESRIVVFDSNAKVNPSGSALIRQRI